MSSQRHMRVATTMGFSLVELMVAMTIGLIVLAAVSTIFVDSKRNYIAQDGMARLQENARVAMQLVGRDMRMAGYFGCADDVTSITNTVNGAAGGSPVDAAVPLMGWEGGAWYPTTASAAATPPGVHADTDAVLIRYLDPSTSVAVDPPFMPNTSAALHTSGTGMQVGEIVVVSDCSGAAVFQVTGPGGAGDPITGTVVHNTGEGTPGNSTKDLGKIFEDDATISKYYYAVYYIADGSSGEPALWRQVLVNLPTGIAAQSQELVEGIENLQILYGEDTANDDRVPDIYRTADDVGDWNNVVSARVGLLARTLANLDSGSKESGVFRDTTPGYDLDGDGVYEANYDSAKNDGYQRRVFRTTVTLRNLQ